MKNLFYILLVGLMFAGVARAQDSDVSVDLALDGYSGYIWRGGILGSDEKPVLQPSITLGFGESGISFNVWGSAFLSSRNSTEGADELDFTVDYSTTLSEESGVGISLGYIQYTFPNGPSGGKHSEEAYASLSMDNVLAPSVTVYYDFGLIDDYYATVGVGPSLPLGEGDDVPTLDLSASVGFSGDGYGGSAGFNDVTVSASIGFAAGQLSITPTVGVTIPDDGVNPDTTIWGGISIGFSPASE
jgi:hypothetical protein